MGLSIDVVIVAYNGWEMTADCMAHLAAQTREHRLFVTDNGSTDGSAERVKATAPDAGVVRLEENMPFALACNAGVDAGSGDVVVLMNNDVNCQPDFLEKLVAQLEADERLGTVVPLLLRPGEKDIDSVGLTADPTLAGFQRFHGQPASRAPEEHPSLMGPAGTAAAYRRTAWRQAGGLDERIFAYWEDFDLSLRLRSAGWGTTRALDAVGVHIGSATHGKRSAWQRRHGGFGRGYLLRRYGVLRTRVGPRAALTEAIVVVVDALIHRDLAALKGRVAGFHAARGLERHPFPPPEAVDRSISFRESLRLRRGIYRG